MTQQKRPKSFRRTKLYVDGPIQFTLVLRIVAYWFVAAFTVTLVLLTARILYTGSAAKFYESLDSLWMQYRPLVFATIPLVPMFIYDILRFTNRFVGPLTRLRENMRRLARGEAVRPIKFRDGDIWPEVAEEFNAIVRRVQELEAAVARGRSAPATEPEVAISGASA